MPGGGYALIDAFQKMKAKTTILFPRTRRRNPRNPAALQMLVFAVLQPVQALPTVFQLLVPGRVLTTCGDLRTSEKGDMLKGRKLRQTGVQEVQITETANNQIQSSD